MIEKKVLNKTKIKNIFKENYNIKVNKLTIDNIKNVRVKLFTLTNIKVVNKGGKP